MLSRNLVIRILFKEVQQLMLFGSTKENMPHSFFEVEHSTDIQNSLLKFNDLRDFSSRMIIVADISRKKEYESKIKYSSFKKILLMITG